MVSLHSCGELKGESDLRLRGATDLKRPPPPDIGCSAIAGKDTRHGSLLDGIGANMNSRTYMPVSKEQCVRSDGFSKIIPIV